ncbi:MAG: hypothetical protein V3V19_03725 [Cocleimonas sp.]
MSYTITTYLIDKEDIENIWQCKDQSTFNKLSPHAEEDHQCYLQGIIDGVVNQEDAWELKLTYISLAKHYGEEYESYLYGDEHNFCIECLMDEDSSFFIPLPDEEDFPVIKSVEFSEIENLSQHYLSYLEECNYMQPVKEDMAKECQQLITTCKEKQKSLIFIYS